MTTAIILNIVFSAVVIAVLARVMMVGYRLPGEQLAAPRSIQPRPAADRTKLAA